MWVLITVTSVCFGPCPWYSRFCMKRIYMNRKKDERKIKEKDLNDTKLWLKKRLVKIKEKITEKRKKYLSGIF